VQEIPLFFPVNHWVTSQRNGDDVIWCDSSNEGSLFSLL